MEKLVGVGLVRGKRKGEIWRNMEKKDSGFIQKI